MAHRVARQAMTIDQNVIDVMSWRPAIAGRQAWPERRGEGETLGLRPLAPGPPAHQAKRLARHILKCGLKGLKPDGQGGRIDETMIAGERLRQSRRRGLRPQGRDARIAVRHRDAGQCLESLSPRWALGETLARIEELEGNALRPTLSRHRPLRHGPHWHGLHRKAAGGEEDQPPGGRFGRPQHPQNLAPEL